MAASSTEPRVVVIDEDGDTILTLKGPIQELVECDNDSDTKSNTDSDTATNRAVYSDSGSDSDSCSGSEVELTASFDQVAVTHYHVSSTMLKNASKSFRNIFSGGFRETIPNPDDGKYHITAEGFDPDALEMILNIVHSKKQYLFEEIKLELLTYIAVVIDYYYMEEATSSHTNFWATDIWLREGISEEPCRDMFLRTFVSKMFGHENGFDCGAKILIQKSRGPIPDVGIPTLGVAELIDDCRLRAITAMIDKTKAVYNLWDTEMSSNSHRGDIVLHRCREIKFSGQYIRDIKPPFLGVSYESFRSKVITIHSHYPGPGHDWSDETLSDYRIYRTLFDYGLYGTLSDYGLFHILDSGVEIP